MLLKQAWMKPVQDFRVEMKQAQEEGRAVSAEMLERAERLYEADQMDAAANAEAEAIYQEVQALPLLEGYAYQEPDGLEEIRTLRDGKGWAKASNADPLYDQVYGGWLGRCGGCLLGQPVEGWKRDRIVGLLKDSGNWPISCYISSELPQDVRERYQVTDEGGAYGAVLKGWINNVECMPEDDDTNYTALALRLVEKYGRDFTSEDVAECWLSSLPILHTCTAERVAYRNLCALILPPASGYTNNPYREWIGAQIRGDFFGYVNPGNPELAAEMAWRDARISHVKNGIYGEMFAAAMIAAAFVEKDPAEILRQGIAQIPKTSRLYQRIMEALEWHKQGFSADDAVNKVHALYSEFDGHDWCHTISNAMLVAIGLLYGGMEYAPSIALGVHPGFDTDCNGATIGSVVGVALGAQALPAEWIDPLNDQLISGVDGFGRVRISELAERTVRCASPTV